MKKGWRKLSAVSIAVLLSMTACGSDSVSAGNGVDTKAGSTGDLSEYQADSEAGLNTNQTQDLGVNHTDSQKNDTSVISAAAYTETMIDFDKLFSDRDLSGEYDAAKCDHITLSDDGCSADSRNVAIDGSTVTITGEGDYIVSGTLSSGMIIVDVDKTEKVQLVLNGVNITSETSAAIYVRQADKVFVTLADNTQNVLANGGAFEAIDDNNIDSVIFSKDDLTLNGTGALAINSPAGHGIVSKNDLVITNGDYEIKADSHGMTGKDSVAAAGGRFHITAGKSAIKSEDDSDMTVGSVAIVGGEYVLSAGTNGISALNEINISGGTIEVVQSNEGMEARLINITGGEIVITAQDDGLNATDKRTNKDNSEASIYMTGGVVSIDAEGDGVDSNGSLVVGGGELYVAGSSGGGDSALDYDIAAVISGGIVVAAGQNGMAQNFGMDSTQGAILVSTPQQNAEGSEIVLLDSKGTELVAWTAQKSYNSVVISCPQISAEGTYTVKTGEITTEVTMDGLIYGGNFGAGGGRPGGKGGGRPEGMSDFENGGRPEGMPEPPDFENGERPEGKPGSSEFKSGGRPEGMSGAPDFENGGKPEEIPEQSDYTDGGKK